MFKKLNIVLGILLINSFCFASPSTTINTPNSFSPNTTISSSSVNDNFNEVATKFNTHTHTDITQLGVVTTGTWAATPIQTSYVASGAGAITGEVKVWAGTTSNIPSSFLSCDGSAVSRATYAALFAIIGTNYGIGDGTTTFNLPDWNSDKFLRGSTTAGTAGGSDSHTHDAGSYISPSHTHTVSGTASANWAQDPGLTHAQGVLPSGASSPVTTSASGSLSISGTSGSSSNLPAYRTGIFIIKT